MSESVLREHVSAVAPVGVKLTRRWRQLFRFSLAHLMIVTLLLVLAVSHFRTSRELHDARRELLMFRRAHGILGVTDTTKVHVLAIPGLEFKNWKWHVYWPEGLPCRLSASSRVAPRKGLPSRDLVAISETFRAPAQFTIDAKVDTDSEGRNVVVIRGPFGVQSHVIPPEDSTWLERGANANWSQAGSMGTDFFPTSESVILVHLQYMPGPGIGQTGNFYEDPNDPVEGGKRRSTPGLAIWLDVPTEPR